MITFCTQCGHATTLKTPLGDSLPRNVCTACGFIHYINPKIICGALVTQGHQILMCRRAIEPRYGKWTLPAGFMELNETLEQGAARETYEEAHAHIEIEQLYCMYNLPHIGQVYMLFKARLTSDFGAGEETIETRLFDEAEIPWNELAFHSIEHTLRHYLHDRQHLTVGNQALPFHLETIHEQIRR